MENKSSELNRKCRSLQWWDPDAFEDLCRQYGYADVLGTLAFLWPTDKAVELFRYCFPRADTRREINTIAVFYIRGYNGGIERVNAGLMGLWTQMGYRVVFFSNEPENDLDFSYPSGVKRIVIPSRDHMHERLKALQLHCEQEKVDIFINHNWNDSRSVWECLLMKHIGIPYAQYCHGHFSWCFSQGKTALYQPEAFKFCDLTIALSETNARFYQMCGCRTYLVQNPIPEDLINVSSEGQADSHSILLIGRISEEKYPLEALAIFKTLHDLHPEAILDIVGDGEKELIDRMRCYISESDLEDAVVFHGSRNNNEVAEFYKRACCVLFTSKMEGYPMVVLEAKAFGLPIVMYDMPFLSLTKDGKGILTAPPGDVRKMAENLVSLFEDASVMGRLHAEAEASFRTFKEYDLEKAWRNIFGLCAGDMIDSEDYYDPDTLPLADRCIIPSLLDKIKNGYDSVFASRDYRIGSSVLKIPRIVKKTLRNAKGKTVE